MSTSTGFSVDKSSKRYEELLRATAAFAACRDCETFERRFASGLRRVIDFDYLNFVIFDEADSTVEWNLFESTVNSPAVFLRQTCRLTGRQAVGFSSIRNFWWLVTGTTRAVSLV